MKKTSRVKDRSKCKTSHSSSGKSDSSSVAQLDYQEMHRDYIKLLSIRFEHMSSEEINKLACQNLSAAFDLLSYLEFDIEDSIRDRVVSDQEFSCADRSDLPVDPVDLFHDHFSSIGETQTERIGKMIVFSESSKLFSKYLTFLACIHNNHPGSEHAWNHLLKLFTQNRYEAMQRLLKCKKSLSRESGTTLARFILKRCRKKTGKRNYPVDLDPTFQKTFDLKRDYTTPNLNVRVMNLDNVKNDIEKLRVHLTRSDKSNLKPKRITAASALLFLALLYAHQTPKAELVALDTIDELMKDCGVDLSERNDIEITARNMITHLQRETLKHFKELISIFGDKSGWELRLKKNVKIACTPNTHNDTIYTLFKKQLGPK